MGKGTPCLAGRARTPSPAEGKSLLTNNSAKSFRPASFRFVWGQLSKLTAVLSALGTLFAFRRLLLPQELLATSITFSAVNVVSVTSSSTTAPERTFRFVYGSVTSGNQCDIAECSVHWCGESTQALWFSVTDCLGRPHGPRSALLPRKSPTPAV